MTITNKAQARARVLGSITMVIRDDITNAEYLNEYIDSNKRAHRLLQQAAKEILAELEEQERACLRSLAAKPRRRRAAG